GLRATRLHSAKQASRRIAPAPSSTISRTTCGSACSDPCAPDATLRIELALLDRSFKLAVQKRLIRAFFREGLLNPPFCDVGCAFACSVTSSLRDCHRDGARAGRSLRAERTGDDENSKPPARRPRRSSSAWP